MTTGSVDQKRGPEALGEEGERDKDGAENIQLETETGWEPERGGQCFTELLLSGWKVLPLDWKENCMLQPRTRALSCSVVFLPLKPLTQLESIAQRRQTRVPPCMSNMNLLRTSDFCTTVFWGHRLWERGFKVFHRGVLLKMHFLL